MSDEAAEHEPLTYREIAEETVIFMDRLALELEEQGHSQTRGQNWRNYPADDECRGCRIVAMLNHNRAIAREALANARE